MDFWAADLDTDGHIIYSLMQNHIIRKKVFTKKLVNIQLQVNNCIPHTGGYNGLVIIASAERVLRRFSF